MAVTITACTIQHLWRAICSADIILALKVNEYNIYCPIHFVYFCVAYFYCPWSCNYISYHIIQAADIMNINVRPTAAAE